MFIYLLLGVGIFAEIEQIGKSIQYQEKVKQSTDVWIIQYQTSQDQITLFQQFQSVYHHFLKFASIQTQLSQFKSNGLYFYSDQTLTLYQGKTNQEQFHKWTLNQINKVIEERSKQAKGRKLRQQQQEKQLERIKNEHQEQMKLRLRSEVIILKQKNYMSQIQSSRDPWIVNLYIANCSQCRQLNKQWQKIPEKVDKKLKIAKINCTSDVEIGDIYKIQKYPQIFYYPSGVKKINQPKIYDGVKKSITILKWIQDQSKALKQESGSSQLVGAQQFKSHCKGKGICLITFLQKNSQKNQNILNSLAKMSKSMVGKPISIFYSWAKDQKQLQQQFQVASYPTALFLQCKRKKAFKISDEDFSTARVQQKTDQIMLGDRNNFVAYKFQQKVIDK